MRTVKSFKVFTAMATVLIAVLIGQLAASANDATVYHNMDYATVNADEMYGAVCDGERDGHMVIGTWHLINGNRVTEVDSDDQGCDDVGPFEAPAYKVEICEEFRGCRVEHV